MTKSTTKPTLRSGTEPARKMTAEHKAALAQGRAEGRAVKVYLEALEKNRPRRGRKRTPESIKKRLSAIAAQLANASALQRLQLIQERMDLEGELAQLGAKVDLSALEDSFVRTARKYSERKGISYAAWRQLGVSADTLKKAGITR
ncbi:MAG: hypothetical protein WD271_12100 [Acidimicrobiia bacterium]